MILSLIVAVSENNVIGADGDLPWRLSHDLRRFKRLTMGHPIIMGRKTFESLGRLLPGRTTIVITRQPNFDTLGGLVANSMNQAVELATKIETEEAFVIGGAQIYQMALPLAERIYMTRVHGDVPGDTYFEPLGDEWKQCSNERHLADERNEHDYSFVTYELRKTDERPIL